MADFCQLNLLGIFERYRLPGGSRVLLAAYDNFKKGIVDEAEIGRLVRLSSTNRPTLVAMMTQCANIMKNDDTETKFCSSIISMCGEMIEIADKSSSNGKVLPFTKFPREIRERIYELYLNNLDEVPTVYLHLNKLCKCRCIAHVAPKNKKYERVDMNLALTCKGISEEVLTCVYAYRPIHFSCACEMGYRLRTNALLKATMKHVMFHWCGPRADRGIRQLHSVPNLVGMIVEISKSTSRYLTARETEIREFFGPGRSGNAVHESLGWDELIAIRGLQRGVFVNHVPSYKAERRNETERQALELMLQTHLTPEFVDGPMADLIP